MQKLERILKRNIYAAELPKHRENTEVFCNRISPSEKRSDLRAAKSLVGMGFIHRQRPKPEIMVGKVVSLLFFKCQVAIIRKTQEG